MPDLAQDPILLSAVGVLILGMVMLLWAVNRLRQAGAEEGDLLEESDATGVSTPPMLTVPPTFPPMPPPPAPARMAPPPRELLERLEGMSMRLGEMEALLQRQAAQPSSSLSPEASSRLLKIISSVSEQLQSLERELGIPSAPTRPAPKL